MGARVLKYFPPNPLALQPCPGGWYGGKVGDVGVHEGSLEPLFRIDFDDGDVADVFLEELLDILVAVTPDASSSEEGGGEEEEQEGDDGEQDQDDDAPSPIPPPAADDEDI